ncbi:MAG: DUF1549 and DUF1553 domain-containing protein [Gemmataceae bacterium]
MRHSSITLLLVASCILFTPRTILASQPQDGNSRQLVRLVVQPKKIELRGDGALGHVLLTAEFSDGSVKDVTRLARWKVEDPTLATFQDHAVLGRANGTTQLTAEFATESVVVSVDVQDSDRPRRFTFRHDVMPIFSKASCNAGTCHGNFNGKNGFRLSLRGENPDFDLQNLTRDTTGRRLNLHQPDSSLLLQKPAGGLPHEGGVRFSRDSKEYAALRRWIAAGAHPDKGRVSALTRLEVYPSDLVLLHGEREQQIIARATFSDGTQRDVTDLAAYEPSIETVEVSSTGLVTASKSTQVTVVVRYLNEQQPVRLAFVPERKNFHRKPVRLTNYIDREIFGRLKELRIEPSLMADDATFLRRAYLDVTGRLPTISEVKAYLKSDDPKKREKLIDSLLERPEYADFWALKWADLLRVEEKSVDVNGVKYFHKWIRKSIADNKQLDQFARELVTGRGSTYKNPPANYYRTNRQPQLAAETTARLFMGVRIACAKCHNHPFDRWTQEDYFGLSACFARIETKMVNNKRRDKLNKHELNGEMIVSIAKKGEVSHPKTGGTMPPRLPNGSVADVKKHGDRPKALAAWLATKENPFFARVMANRIWYHLMGRGLVEPVDDFRVSNPASHEKLLDELADDFVRHRFDQKYLIRRIMNTRAYQLSSKPTETNQEDEINFSYVHPRLLSAEQLLDAISQVTEVPENFKGHPKGTRAVQLPGVLGAPKFLQVFGRPDRLLACECERQSATTLNQAFQMISGDMITRKVNGSPRVRRLLQQKVDAKAIITEFYLAALSRYPTQRELDVIGQRLTQTGNRQRTTEDLLWAILNTKEFLLRR